MRRLILILLFAACALGADKPFVRARWHGATLDLTYQGKTTSTSFGADARAGAVPYRSLLLYAIGKAKTLYVEEKQERVYLVMDISGPSRGPEAASNYCGAGSESALVLFVLDANGQVRPPEFMRYESCFETIEADSDGAPREADGKIVTTLVLFRQLSKENMPVVAQGDPTGQITVQATFDEAHPEQGIDAVEKCVWFKPHLRGMEVPCPTSATSK
ncbi:MAG TPA: hypothetical protein VL382_06745 [Terriglobales bacterium]|nr:hypothetical protein [Terriglobales bacterium]